MAIDSPRREMHTTAEADGVVSRVTLQLRQFMCGLHGHDALLHFERGRMSLLCTSCGHETPGWEVKTAAARQDAHEPKPRVLRMPLVGQRRVA